MKNRFFAIAAAAVLSTAGVASAAVYNDSLGENFDGNAHMDIKSVTVTNTATDISFAVQLNGPIGVDGTNNWGKYMVGIDSVAGGDTGNPVGNPWGRNIRIGAGMDAWIGSWADAGVNSAAQPFTFNAGWTQNGQHNVVIAGDTTTITVPLASLGLSLGQTFSFDVYSGGGGGGDSANDAAGNPNQTVNDWQVPYDSGSLLLQYTVAVPEPTTLGVIGLASLAAFARRRRA